MNVMCSTLISCEGRDFHVGSANGEGREGNAEGPDLRGGDDVPHFADRVRALNTQVADC